MEKIKVIVVDDSAFMRRAIAEIIESEPTFEVVAKLRNGQELIEQIDELKPDIITLDVHMKELDGLSTLKELKKLKKESPIIMLSSATTDGSKMTLECLENGAISFITKPSGSISLDIAIIKEDLIAQIKSIVHNSDSIRKGNCEIKEQADRKETIDSELKVEINNIPESKVKRTIISNSEILKNKKIDAVVIGASTGGPKALQEVLTQLPSDLGVPVFVVQHMPEGFTKVFAERLDKICNMNVVEAQDGMKIDKAFIYIAKGGSHMKIMSKNMISLNDKEPAIWGVRPAVDKLFESAAQVYGSNVISVVLTGMGRDGAIGTSIIKDSGGITIAEDKSTCTIYGMPKAAYETGKVDLIIPLNEVCEKITNIVKRI